MNKNCFWSIAAFFCVFFGNILLFPACAEISVSPAQLAVMGIQGNTETRTLVLKTDKPLADLKIIFSDLNRSDGKTVFPSASLDAKISETRAEGILSVAVTVKLAKVPCGEFTGELLLKHRDGLLSVPLTVKVKSGPFWPLIIIAAGVFLSFIVTRYRTSGRPRDEIMVRIAQVNAQIRKDAELSPCFKNRINACIVDAEAALPSEKWSDAQNSVLRAENLLLRWRKARADWQEQLAYLEKLRESLQTVNPNAMYFMCMDQRIKDTARNAPDQENPDAFGKQLSGLRQQINAYLGLKSLLDEMNAVRMQLKDDLQEQWRMRIFDFERRLDALSPEQEEEFRALRNEAQTALENMKKDISESGNPNMRSAEIQASVLTPPSPSTGVVFTEEADERKARIHLKLFTYTTYGLALAFLAGTGFNELYLSNPVFGAELWSDCFALLAWGFGAEASRASVTDMVKGWGLKTG